MAYASSNTTATDLDDDDEDDLDMDFETFKSTIKRYRRLIPYMSHYVANNHVNNQAESPIYDGNEALSPQRLILRPDRLKPQQHQRVTTLIKQEKFIPSVQYDPKSIGVDTEYFTPVRYNTKPAIYDDYYRDYDRRTVYPEITTTVKVPDNRYYTKERLLPRPQKNNVAYLQPAPKPQQIPNIYQDYYIDYIQRPKPAVQNQEYYPVEGIEDFKFVKIEPPRYQQRAPPIQQLRRPVYSHPPKPALISDENFLRSLQLTNQLPEMLSRDNIDASIKTLVEILSLLQSKKPENIPVHLSEPVVSQNIPSYEDLKEQHYSRPKVVTETRYQVTPAPPVGFKQTRYQNNGVVKQNTYSDYGVKNQEHIEYYQPVVQDIDENGNVHDYEVRPYKVEGGNPPGDYDRPYKIEEKPYKTQGNYEISENVDEGVDKQVETTTVPPKHFQLAEGFLSDALNIPTMAVKYGATRGKPNIDYPAYAAIPETDFSCKDQRYKGFFGDPTTGCQVWHYCDLNGGKSSFLCPNGTIFSQAALTCDWWFNVKCESTTQLYVLNERLYKFILPIMPKFPEDFSGPEVDRYLEMKFKEMEAKMKAKKLKKAMEKKMKMEKTTTVSAIE